MSKEHRQKGSNRYIVIAYIMTKVILDNDFFYFWALCCADIIGA